MAAIVIAAGCASPSLDGRLLPGAGGGFESDGGDGPLTVAIPGQTVNVCHPVVTSSGSSLQMTDVANLVPGRRVLLVQSQDALGDASVDVSGPIVDPLDAGRWEIARVAAIEGTELVLEQPPAVAFGGGDGRRAQACTFPEFTRVVVQGSSSIVAPAWDGAAGGIVAFAADELVLDGAIDVAGAGFRGGVTTDFDPACPNVETLEPNDLSDSAAKGEGLDARGYGRVGRGAVASGGGGGNGCNGGGGGGGGGGVGGAGGRFWNGAHVESGGIGGSGVVSTEPRLIFGGGGGSGHCDELDCPAEGPGAAGGGAVLVIARTLTGAGTVSASGIDGGDVRGNGAGGGGAGGSVVMSVRDGASWDGAIEAIGGEGGDTTGTFQHPAGGGGGGGRIHLEGFGAASAGTDVRGGAAGIALGTPDDVESATAGGDGLAVRIEP